MFDVHDTIKMLELHCLEIEKSKLSIESPKPWFQYSSILLKKPRFWCRFW